MGSSLSAPSLRVHLRRSTAAVSAAAAATASHPVRHLGRFSTGPAWSCDWTCPDQNRTGTNTQAWVWPGLSRQYTTNLKHEQKQIDRTLLFNEGSSETHLNCSSSGGGGQPSGESDGTLHRSSSKDQLSDMSQPWLDWDDVSGGDEADSSEFLDADPDVVLDALGCAVQ